MLKAYPENRFNEMLETLKIPENKKLPVVIYGANGYAKNTWEFLERKGIYATGFAVNRPYFNNSVVDGKTVYVLEDYLEKNECAIVVARGGV